MYSTYIYAHLQVIHALTFMSWNLSCCYVQVCYAQVMICPGCFVHFSVSKAHNCWFPKCGAFVKTWKNCLSTLGCCNLWKGWTNCISTLDRPCCSNCHWAKHYMDIRPHMPRIEWTLDITSRTNHYMGKTNLDKATGCNDSGYRTIKYDEQLGVDCLLVRDRLAIQAPKLLIILGKRGVVLWSRTVNKILTVLDMGSVLIKRSVRHSAIDTFFLGGGIFQQYKFLDLAPLGDVRKYVSILYSTVHILWSQDIICSGIFHSRQIRF